jgi:hypothetical protein
MKVAKKLLLALKEVRLETHCNLWQDTYTLAIPLIMGGEVEASPLGQSVQPTAQAQGLIPGHALFKGA